MTLGTVYGQSYEVERVARSGVSSALQMPVGEEFALKEIVAEDWPGLTVIEQRSAGKFFRKLVREGAIGSFTERKTSDNEWQYRRLAG